MVKISVLWYARLVMDSNPTYASGYMCSTVKEGGPFLLVTSFFLPYGEKSRDYSGKLGNTLGNYIKMPL